MMSVQRKHVTIDVNDCLQGMVTLCVYGKPFYYLIKKADILITISDIFLLNKISTLFC